MEKYRKVLTPRRIFGTPLGAGNRDTIHNLEMRVSARSRKHVRRLLVGLAFILIGIILPDFEPSIVHSILSETLKGIGAGPLLKIVESMGALGEDL